MWAVFDCFSKVYFKNDYPKLYDLTFPAVWPDDQLIKTNQTNILIRSLTLKKQKAESSSKDVKGSTASEASRKRCLGSCFILSSSFTMDIQATGVCFFHVCILDLLDLIHFILSFTFFRPGERALDGRASAKRAATDTQVGSPQGELCLINLQPALLVN